MELQLEKLWMCIRMHRRKILNTPKIFSTKTCAYYSSSPITPDPECRKCDFIGLPDKISNIRPLILFKKENETPLEKQLRESRIHVHNWNQEFWFKHNQQFYKERAEYMNDNKPKDGSTTLTADEMSKFYKLFLDKNWKTHLNYNIQWYKKNIGLLVLSFRVNLENIFKTK